MKTMQTWDGPSAPTVVRPWISCFRIGSEAQLFEQTDDLGSVLSIWIRDEAVCISVKQILVKLFGYFKCTSAQSYQWMWPKLISSSSRKTRHSCHATSRMMEMTSRSSPTCICCNTPSSISCMWVSRCFLSICENSFSVVLDHSEMFVYLILMSVSLVQPSKLCHVFGLATMNG